MKAAIRLILTVCLASCVRTPAQIHRDYAKKLEPVTFAGTEGAQQTARLQLRVRVRVAPGRRRVLGWRSQFEASVRDANAALIAATRAELKIVSFKDWPNAPGSNVSTQGQLKALREADNGEGVDIVIGLADPVSLYLNELDGLGAAEVGGQRLVLRNSSSVKERDHISQTLNLVSKKDLDKLFRKRRRHRAAVVLLHELGHIMGAHHIEAAGAIMRSSYNQYTSVFSEPTRERMLAWIDAHASVKAPESLARKPSPLEVNPPQHPRDKTFDRQLKALHLPVQDNQLASLKKLAHHVDRQRQTQLIEQLISLYHLEEAEILLNKLQPHQRCELQQRIAHLKARLPAEDLPLPQRPDARSMLTYLMESTQTAYNQRFERLQSLERKHKGSVSVLVGRCFTYFERQGESSACKEALLRNDNAALAHLLYGAGIARRNPKSALESLQRSIELDPDPKLGWRLLNTLAKHGGRSLAAHLKNQLQTICRHP